MAVINLGLMISAFRLRREDSLSNPDPARRDVQVDSTALPMELADLSQVAETVAQAVTHSGEMGGSGKRMVETLKLRTV
jgi:hypothetical protein